MTAVRRVRRSRAQRLAAWLLASIAVAATVFAVVGAASAEPTFDPADTNVPVGAVALIALTTLAFVGVGARVAAGVPGNPIGWLLLAAGCCVAATLAGMQLVALHLPLEQWGMWLTEWASLGTFFLLVFVLLLFPDGQLPSQRWRPARAFAYLTMGAALTQTVVPYQERGGRFTNPIGISWLDHSILVGNRLGFILLPFAFTAAGASAVARFRHAGPVARQQLKWFAFAGGTVATAYLVQNLTWLLQDRFGSALAGAGFVVLVVSFATIPMACGMAILRYRLYEIDRVVSRTLAYLVLTTLVIAIYVGVIALTTSLLPARSGVGVAAATLAAAAAAAPLRRRVQLIVDKQFNRAHYDAAAVVESFAAQLRGALGTDAVSARLVTATRQAVEPAHLSVWLRH